MMNRKLSTLMLAAAALLASCSQDDALQNTENTNEGLKPMTITASLPTDGMQTRAEAEGDAAATRCYVQILNGNGTELEGDNSKPIEMTPNGSTFTTTVYLNGSKIYDFLFWADTETATNQNVPTDLTAVAYTNGQTIAWAGNALDKMWDADGVSVTLSHVVSRVTVITTSYFAGSEAWPFTVTVPTVYNKYNVAEGAVVEDSKDSDGYELNVTDGEYDANTEVCHFYVLGGSETSQDQLTLQYKGPKENPVIPFSNVPLLPNYHITLKGDIYNAGLVNGTITATTTIGWDTPEKGDIPFN